MKRKQVKVRDLIILLPGITGSVLHMDGKDVWAPSYRPVLDLLLSWGGSLEKLMLKGDDPELEDLGDGVVATGLVPDAVMLAGLVKIDGYTFLSKTIRDSLGVRDGTGLRADEKPYPPPNFFEFPYDWRRDNRFTARRLKELINLRLPQWQDYAGEDAKVILIAHSMGGLVARYYLEVLDGSEKCRALITLGTPYAGSLNALDFLVHGLTKFSINFKEKVAPFTSFTSVYQLLPIYDVVNTDDGLKKVTDLVIDGVNEGLARRAAAFHHEIMDKVDARVKKGAQSPYQILPILGTYQPTLQSADLHDGLLTVTETLPPGAEEMLWHGDGTVPLLSAAPHEMAESFGKTLCPESHGSLQRNLQLVSLICDQIEDSQIKRPSLRGGVIGGRERTAFSLRIKDVFAPDEPVVIVTRVYDGDAELTDADKLDDIVGTVAATFEPADAPGVGITVESPRTTDGVWRLERPPMQPGLYRVTVEAHKAGPRAPLPVQDLFEVAAAA
jgi:pimeloyl-ACP methyl ester carboxylesterase